MRNYFIQSENLKFLYFFLLSLWNSFLYLFPNLFFEFVSESVSEFVFEFVFEFVPESVLNLSFVFVFAYRKLGERSLFNCIPSELYAFPYWRTVNSACEILHLCTTVESRWPQMCAVV